MATGGPGSTPHFPPSLPPEEATRLEAPGVCAGFRASSPLQTGGESIGCFWEAHTLRHCRSCKRGCGLAHWPTPTYSSTPANAHAQLGDATILLQQCARHGNTPHGRWSCGPLHYHNHSAAMRMPREYSTLKVVSWISGSTQPFCSNAHATGILRTEGGLVDL